MSTSEQTTTAGRRRMPGAEPDRKSTTLKFRVRDDLRDRLERSANKSGRSVSEEIERRLVNSYDLEPVHLALYGNGHDAFQLINSIANVITEIMNYSKRNGSIYDVNELGKNPANCAAVFTAVHMILDKCVSIDTPEDIDAPIEQMSAETREIFRMIKLGEYLGLHWTGRASDIVELMMRQRAAEN